MRKKTLLFCLVLPLFAQNYTQLLHNVDNSLILKSAKKLTQSAKKMSEAAKGANLPSLNLSLHGIYLKDTPTMYLHLPQTPVMGLPMGKKEQWQGELRLTYPLFSGFAITASIDKARLAYEKAKLKTKDLKRNLYLNTTTLYSSIYALKQRLKAQKKAKEAIDLAYKKAKGLYDKGLLAPSELYNIEAKRYDIKAQIIQTKSQIGSLFNELSLLLNTKVDSIGTLLPLSTPKKRDILQYALHHRDDLLALKKALHIDKQDEILAKSSYYPKIALLAALKRHGDSISLNGDGFTNADQSYVAAAVEWNLFNGFSDKNKIQAAKIKTLATMTQIRQYKNQIKTQINNAFIKLRTIFNKIQSVKAEVKARKAYYKLTFGRFENQLASADELSRSIADLAAARAKLSALRASLFNQKSKIYLLAGLNFFKKKILQNEK